MEWIDPWHLIEDLGPGGAEGLEVELQREMKAPHELHGLPVAVLGYRRDCDDVLLRLLDGSGRVAVVYLTRAGERERPPWPVFRLFATLEQWAEGG